MTAVQTVQANGIAMRYADEGPKDAPAIVMSHSLSAELEMWRPQADALKDRYRVVRYDTRGHGGTEVTPGPYTLELLAEDAMAFCDALGLERPHWVGLSMGGMIGQTAALAAPGRFRTLTLADTASGYPPEAAAGWGERIDNARANGMAAMVDATVDRWFSPGFVASGAPVLDRVRAMIANTPVEGFCACGAGIAQLNLTHRLGEIAIPTLVICGEDDPGTPLEMSEIMAAGIPGARLAVLPVARHLSNLEDVDGFNAALSGFLDAN